MKAKLFLIMAIMLTTSCTNARTLVVYYSFTNNVHTIVSDLATQIDADVVRIEPAEKGLDYAADNYAVGSALISAIRNRVPMMPHPIPPSTLWRSTWQTTTWSSWLLRCGGARWPLRSRPSFSSMARRWQASTSD